MLFLYGCTICRQILSQICDHIPGDLHGRGRPGITRGKLRVYAGGMIHKVRIKAGSLDLTLAQISSELMHQRAHHFKVTQLLSTFKLFKMEQQEMKCYLCWEARGCVVPPGSKSITAAMAWLDFWDKSEYDGEHGRDAGKPSESGALL